MAMPTHGLSPLIENIPNGKLYMLKSEFSGTLNQVFISEFLMRGKGITLR
jgi:hypothetical protein